MTIKLKLGYNFFLFFLTICITTSTCVKAVDTSSQVVSAAEIIPQFQTIIQPKCWHGVQNNLKGYPNKELQYNISSSILTTLWNRTKSHMDGQLQQGALYFFAKNDQDEYIISYLGVSSKQEYDARQRLSNILILPELDKQLSLKKDKDGIWNAYNSTKKDQINKPLALYSEGFQTLQETFKQSNNGLAIVGLDDLLINLVTENMKTLSQKFNNLVEQKDGLISTANIPKSENIISDFNEHLKYVKTILKEKNPDIYKDWNKKITDEWPNSLNTMLAKNIKNKETIVKMQALWRERAVRNKIELEKSKVKESNQVEEQSNASSPKLVDPSVLASERSESVQKDELRVVSQSQINGAEIQKEDLINVSSQKLVHPSVAGSANIQILEADESQEIDQSEINEVLSDQEEARINASRQNLLNQSVSGLASNQIVHQDEAVVVNQSQINAAPNQQEEDQSVAGSENIQSVRQNASQAFDQSQINAAPNQQEKERINELSQKLVHPSVAGSANIQILEADESQEIDQLPLNKIVKMQALWRGSAVRKKIELEKNNKQAQVKLANNQEEVADVNQSPLQESNSFLQVRSKSIHITQNNAASTLLNVSQNGQPVSQSVSKHQRNKSADDLLNKQESNQQHVQVQQENVHVDNINMLDNPMLNQANQPQSHQHQHQNQLGAHNTGQSNDISQTSQAIQPNIPRFDHTHVANTKQFQADQLSENHSSNSSSSPKLSGNQPFKNQTPTHQNNQFNYGQTNDQKQLFDDKESFDEKSLNHKKESYDSELERNTHEETGLYNDQTLASQLDNKVPTNQQFNSPEKLADTSIDNSQVNQSIDNSDLGQNPDNKGAESKNNNKKSSGYAIPIIIIATGLVGGGSGLLLKVYKDNKSMANKRKEHLVNIPEQQQDEDQQESQQNLEINNQKSETVK